MVEGKNKEREGKRMKKGDIKIITNAFICKLAEVRRNIEGFKAEIIRLKMVETEILDLNKRIRL